MKIYLVILVFLMMNHKEVEAQQILPYTKNVYSTGKDSLPYRLLYPLRYSKHMRIFLKVIPADK